MADLLGMQGDVPVLPVFACLFEGRTDDPGAVPRRLAKRGGSERVPKRGVVCPVGAVTWNILGEAVEHW
ncbi:hypothetical protein HMPREF2751_02605 [Corynebacterium sp. HMSC063G05]|nr:hypothetical protein HMPREF2751_02605 [Corynebacterium sp. HMSC063G05]